MSKASPNDYVCPVCGEWYDGDNCEACDYANWKILKKKKAQEKKKNKEENE